MDTQDSSTDGADEDAYVCDKCKRKFTRNVSLTRHRCGRMHTRLYKGPPAQHVARVAMRQWPYRCHVCGHRYTNGREMTVHMKQRHWLKSGREPCVCRTCLRAGWIRVPLGELQRQAQLAEEQPNESPPRTEEQPNESPSRTEEQQNESMPRAEEQSYESMLRAEEQPNEWPLRAYEQPNEWQLRAEEQPNECPLRADEQPNESTSRAEEQPYELPLRADEQPNESTSRAEEQSYEWPLQADEQPNEWPLRAEEQPFESMLRAEEQPNEWPLRAEEQSYESMLRAEKQPNEWPLRADEQPNESTSQAEEQPYELPLRTEEQPYELPLRAEELLYEWQLQVEEQPNEWQLRAEDQPNEGQLRAEEQLYELLLLAEEQLNESKSRAEEQPNESTTRARDADQRSSKDKLPGDDPSTAGKRRQCPVCGKWLARKANMIVHVRSHTGERPFQCKKCDKTYAGRGGLRRHEVEKHAAPKCAPRPSARPATAPVEKAAASGDRDVDGPVASVLAEDESVVRVLLGNRQVSSVPARKEPVVVVSEDGDGPTVVMAVVPDTSRRTPAATGHDSAVVEWASVELMEQTFRYAKTTRELDEFVERVCHDVAPPPDDLNPSLPCVLAELRLRRDQVEVTEPATGAKRYRCHVCCKNLKRSITWRRHLRAHGFVTTSGPPRPAQYACDGCSVTVRTRKEYREHMKTVHGRGRPRKNQKKNTTACPLCRSVLYDRFSLVRHTRLKHGFPNVPCFACSIPPAHAAEFAAHLADHSSACERAHGPPTPAPRTAD